MKHLFLSLLALALLGACKTSPNDATENEDFAIQSVDGDKVLLRLNPKKGDKQAMLFQTNVSMEGAQKMKMEMQMKLNMDVTEKSDSAASYSGKIAEIKMDMDMQGLNMGYDSSDPESAENPMSQAFKPLLENPFSLEITKLGKVQNVNMPNLQGAPTGDQIDFSGMSVSFPKEAVGVGDSWTNVQKIPQANTEFTYQLTVTKITVDEVHLDIDSDLSKLAAQEGVKFDEFKGNYILDRKTSFTKNGVVNMTMDVPEAGKMKIETLFKSL